MCDENKDSTEDGKEASDSSEQNEEKILLDVKENVDASPDAAKEDPDEENELEEENTLDEKEGTLKIGGKIVEIAPPLPERPPTPEDDRSLSDLMLANNMEITICKAPPGEIGIRRISSSSNGSGKHRSISPSNDCPNESVLTSSQGQNSSVSSQNAAGKVTSLGKDTGLTSAVSNVGQDRVSVSPALSVEGSVGKTVSEAELMLASVSDGEITITKSSSGVVGRTEVAGKSPSVESSGKSR